MLNASANYWSFNRNIAVAQQMATGFRMSRSEWLLELNYSYQLAPGVAIQPVVAYVINPDGGLGSTSLFQPNGRPRRMPGFLARSFRSGSTVHSACLPSAAPTDAVAIA